MNEALRKLTDHTASDAQESREALFKGAEDAGPGGPEAQDAGARCRDGEPEPLSDEEVSRVSGGSRPKGGFC